MKRARDKSDNIQKERDAELRKHFFKKEEGKRLVDKKILKDAEQRGTW